MRFKIGFIVFFLATFLQAQIPQIVQLTDSLRQSAPLRHAQWSVYARYADNGPLIVDLNGEQSLAPASGLKAFTSAAALEILGADYRFITRLVSDGTPNAMGVLHGNLYLIGSGDPTLGSVVIKGVLPFTDLLKYWVKAIRKAGLKEIDGQIIADDRLFSGLALPGKWLWEDMGNYYGAAPSALCIHDNFYFLYLRSLKRIGSPVKILSSKPQIPSLFFRNFLTAAAKGSGDNAYIYCAPKQHLAILRGTIPAGRKKFTIKGSIPDPALFAAQSLKGALLQANITVRSGARRIKPTEEYTPKDTIAEIRSPQLKDIVYLLNKRSINLYAEQLLRAIALKKGKPAGEQAGIETLTSYLKDNRISTEGLYLTDGCGLSPFDQITTKMMVRLLQRLPDKPYFDSFYRSLAVAGDEKDIGYFKYFGKGTRLAKNARIKSGLIQNVRSHSGYLRDRSGRMIVFSLIANHFTVDYKVIDRIHQQVLESLAELGK